MTAEQINSAKRILAEEIGLAKKNQWVRNGEDFPYLAAIALDDPSVRDNIEAAAMVIMMSLVLDRNGIVEMLQANKTDPGSLARTSLANTSPLDLFWIGYRLGRRMESEEILGKMYEGTK